ncbi:MAG TPA: tetratricopeptide repeat protein [Pyrinomonadaceae bacterium]|nr:tetratricopeptide repeat protein [Pyrinomonadaceae bacterium]
MPSVETTGRNNDVAFVRTPAGGYLSVSFVLSFFSSLLAYLGYVEFSAPLIAVAWLVIPLLWITDKIVFDGRRIRRTGLVPFLIARATGGRDRLKVSDIEQVETVAFPGMKRGRNVYFTYRTLVSGKNVRFAFSSRHRGFGDMIRSLLPRLNEDCLDNSSIDLRDYFAEKRDSRQRAREFDIPSSEVLDGSFRDIHLRALGESAAGDGNNIEKANQLRRLANELRLSGLLLQALEAFRRAAILRPRDARLLFEFAECIRSVAGTESDEKLERKARAMMRLAERHAGNDSSLLSRIGESYFQVGDWRRAGIVFKRVLDAVGENFRTLRGQAELALREGKLAHVIHNFAAAEQLAATSSLRRWTQAEIDYFSHLNEDEEYMELEISRVNLLDTLDRTKRSSFRINMLGFLAIAFGLALRDDLITDVGWTVSGVSVIVWIVAVVMTKMLSPRIPFELMETEE